MVPTVKLIRLLKLRLKPLKAPVIRILITPVIVVFITFELVQIALPIDLMIGKMILAPLLMVIQVVKLPLLLLRMRAEKWKVKV